MAAGYLAGAIPEWLLLAIIATVLVQSGIELLRRGAPSKGGADGSAGLDLRAAVLSGAVIGLLGGLVGLILGSRLTGRLSDEQLVRAIGVVLLVAAAGCIAQALT